MRRGSFWRYAGGRVLSFAIIYVILVYVFCALLDAQLVMEVEHTLYWDVTQSAQGLLATGDITEEQYKETVQEMYQQARHSFGFDLPFLERIHMRALPVLRFDFGRMTTAIGMTRREDAPVIGVIGEAAFPTAILFTGAFLIQMFLGIVLGARNANRPGSFVDRVTTFLATATMSVPPAVAALLAVLLFVFAVPIAPSTPYMFQSLTRGEALGPWLLSLLSHLALPLLTVVFLTVWGTAHTVRNLNLGTLQEDFISAARARGIPERRVRYGHGLRASAPPIATLAVTGLFASLWGSFLVEPIFQWRGIGTLFLNAVRMNDMQLLLDLLVIITAAGQLGYLVLDLTYGRLDPRIKVGNPQLHVLAGSGKRERRMHAQWVRHAARAKVRGSRGLSVEATGSEPRKSGRP